MKPSIAEDREEQLTSARDRPHLSHSQIQKYLDCPEKYRLHYIEGLRPRFPPASLIFGRIVHETLSHFFLTGEDPVEDFQKRWNAVCAAPLSYKPREPWERLMETGKTLLGKFVREEVSKVSHWEASEKSFALNITSLSLPFVGIIDLIAVIDGQRTVIDFKTSASSFNGHDAVLSDQLSAYALAEPDAEQFTFCVLIKTKEPKIEWHTTTRSGEQLSDYLEKVLRVSEEIAAVHFYKRPGKWCSWCEFLPVCLGDRTKAQETLIHVP